jgi:hypothetical protein
MLSVEVKLDYVVSAAGRLGRKDWALMFGGAIISMIVADLLPREVMGDLLTMASHVLGYILGGGAGPPQFPPMTPLPPVAKRSARTEEEQGGCFWGPDRRGGRGSSVQVLSRRRRAVSL